MRRQVEEEVVAELHLEVEAEEEGINLPTKQLLNVTSAISLATINMSVQSGIGKPTMQSWMNMKK